MDSEAELGQFVDAVVHETREREQVVAEARSWLGTPFQHQQALKGVGVDCLTLIIAVYRAVFPEVRVEVPDYAPDEFLHQSAERYADGLRPYFVFLGPTWPQMADVVGFHFGRRTVAHVGIALDDAGQFVSALMDNGRVEMGGLEQQGWGQRWSGTWRLRRWMGNSAG